MLGWIKAEEKNWRADRTVAAFVLAIINNEIEEGCELLSKVFEKDLLESPIIQQYIHSNCLARLVILQLLASHPDLKAWLKNTWANTFWLRERSRFQGSGVSADVGCMIISMSLIGLAGMDSDSASAAEFWQETEIRAREECLKTIRVSEHDCWTTVLQMLATQWQRIFLNRDHKLGQDTLKRLLTPFMGTSIDFALMLRTLVALGVPKSRIDEVIDEPYSAATLLQKIAYGAECESERRGLPKSTVELIATLADGWRAERSQSGVILAGDAGMALE